MRTCKFSIVLLVLSMLIPRSASAQTAPKLALSLNTGISASGLEIGFSLRKGLGHHLAVTASVGKNEFRREYSPRRELSPGFLLQNIKLNGKENYSVNVRGFLRQQQSGFYAGIGVGRQRFQVETKTLIPSSIGPLMREDGSIIPVEEVISNIFDKFLDNPKSVASRDFVSFSFVTFVTLSAGYVLVLPDDTRLEFGLTRNTRLYRGGLDFKVPSSGNNRTVTLGEVPNFSRVGLVLTLSKPLF